MQRRPRATDFVDERFTAGVDLVEIRWPERRISRSREDDIRDLQIADRPIIGRCLAADLLCDSQGGFASLIRRTNVANDCRIDGIASYDNSVVANLRAFAFAEAAGNDDEWIGGANQKAEPLQLIDPVACICDCPL